MWPPAAGIFTSPAIRPLSSVLMAWASTGWAATAKPLARAVTTKPRRDQPASAAVWAWGFWKSIGVTP